MTGATVCSGIGAPETALPDIDWKWCAEIERFPSEVLAARHPQSTNLGDITAPDFIERAMRYGPIDLLVAGTPCQAFSVAGLRRSMEDERGNLTLRFVEIANAINPRFLLWENVPGVLSTKDNALGCFAAALAGADAPVVPKSGWTNAGFLSGPRRNAAWRILDAQYFGLAQRRRRVFVVACPRTGADPREILFECEGVPRHSAPRREAGQRTTAGFEVGPSGGRQTDVACTMDARAKDGAIRNQVGMLAMSVTPTLPNSYGAGGIGYQKDGLVVPYRMTAIGEYADDDSASAMKTRDYKDATDLAVTHALTQQCSQATEDGTGRGAPLIPWMNQGLRVQNPDGIADTVTSNPAGGAKINPVLAAHSLAIRGRDGVPQIEMGNDVANAILTPNGGRGGIGVGAVMAFHENQRHELTVNDTAGALKNGGGKPGQGYPAVMVPEFFQDSQFGAKEYDTGGGLRAGRIPEHCMVKSGAAVRRLTPVECERLQGFPDGYTALPGAADGPRYRALGNSMAVPVIAWIGERIRKAGEGGSECAG